MTGQKERKTICTKSKKNDNSSQGSKTRSKVVKVNDLKSAVELTAKMITDFQKGKIDEKQSKTLAYLSQTFISANKVLIEQEEIIRQLELLEARLDSEMGIIVIICCCFKLKIIWVSDKNTIENNCVY